MTIWYIARGAGLAALLLLERDGVHRRADDRPR